MATNFGISYGAISDPISKQIKKQGFKFGLKEVEQFQRDADAITRLRVRGLLSDKPIDSMRKKLTNLIVDHIYKFNKLK